MEQLTTLINNVGFPIAAYLIMVWMCNGSLKDVTKAVQEQTKATNDMIAVLKIHQNVS